MNGQAAMTEEDIFVEAISRRDPADRAAYVAAACEGGGEALRHAVQSLLDAHGRAGEFLETPPRDLRDPGRASSDAVHDGPSGASGFQAGLIGPYRLLERVGTGGMGAVYRAEQSDLPGRAVAVKIIKLGMDTEQVVSRFDAERRALALMDHPNIAKAIDAGATATGRPFFVMEWVGGPPVTRFADGNRYGIAKRLRLFLQVCAAVQHAHQKGIIHRDLKPSNILVATENGAAVPKVIDFGVAKAIGATAFGHSTVGGGGFLGTPAYMSPEQAMGRDVDTRSDVYSLGILLYELLCGVPPFDHRRLAGASVEEARRVITREEAERPSARVSKLEPDRQAALQDTHDVSPEKLERLLRGDLDSIVRKAMEKEVNLRYSTVNAFAADVLRYLNGEPVLARSAGSRYRIGKFIRRHKLAVAAVSTFAAVLAFGIAGTTWGLVRALEQKERAEEKERAAAAAATEAAAISQYLHDVLASANPWDPEHGSQRVQNTSVRQLLDRAGARLDAGALAGQKRVEASVRSTLAAAYAAQGLHKEAEVHLRVAVQLGKEAGAPDEVQLSRDMLALSEVWTVLGREPRAVQLAADALAIRRRLRPYASADIADALDVLSRAQRVFGDFDGAEAMAREALEIRKGLPPYHAFGQAGARTRFNLAMALGRKGKDEDAVSILREVLATDRQTLPQGHPLVATDLYNLAILLGRGGSLTEAIACCSEAVEIRRKSLAEGEQEVSDSVRRLAQFLRADGRYADAESVLLDQRRRVALDKMPPRRRLEFLRSMVALYQEWGQVERLEQSSRELHEEISRQLGGQAVPSDARPSTPGGAEASKRYFDRAVANARLGRFREAEQDLESAVGLDGNAVEPRAYRALLAACAGNSDTAIPTCGELVRHSGENRSPPQLDLILVTALAVEGAAEPQVLLGLADRILVQGQQDQRLLPRSRLLKGFADYRAGRYAESLTYLTDTRLMDVIPEKLTAEFVAAMALHRLGHANEARAKVEDAALSAERLLPRPGIGDLDDGGFTNWVLCQNARREAMRLLGVNAPPRERSDAVAK